MERLIIHNFAGILDATIEVSPITGLIGPQASGKSVIAKLLYFFREIASRIPAAVAEGLESGGYKAECCRRFNRYFPLDSLGATEFELTYLPQNEHVRVLFSKEDGAAEGSLLLEWSDFYPTAIDSYSRRRQERLTALGEADKDAISQAQRILREEYDQEASKVIGPGPSSSRFSYLLVARFSRKFVRQSFQGSNQAKRLIRSWFHSAPCWSKARTCWRSGGSLALVNNWIPTLLSGSSPSGPPSERSFTRIWNDPKRRILFNFRMAAECAWPKHPPGSRRLSRFCC